MVNSLMAEIVSRFSIVVSDRIAAGALPVVGAVGGATVNVIFMNHFQQIAQGHFTVRRLEREYGAETVRLHYAEIAARSRGTQMTARYATAELTLRCRCRGSGGDRTVDDRRAADLRRMRIDRDAAAGRR